MNLFTSVNFSDGITFVLTIDDNDESVVVRIVRLQLRITNKRTLKKRNWNFRFLNEKKSLPFWWYHPRENNVIKFIDDFNLSNDPRIGRPTTTLAFRWMKYQSSLCSK